MLVIGATLLAWFIAQIFLRRCQSDPRTVEFVTALRFSLLWQALFRILELAHGGDLWHYGKLNLE